MVLPTPLYIRKDISDTEKIRMITIVLNDDYLIIVMHMICQGVKETIVGLPSTYYDLRGIHRHGYFLTVG